jgi:hypothetical protein
MPPSQPITNHHHDYHHNLNSTTTTNIPATEQKISIALIQQSRLPPLQELSSRPAIVLNGLFVVVVVVFRLLVLVLTYSRDGGGGRVRNCGVVNVVMVVTVFVRVDIYLF